MHKSVFYCKTEIYLFFPSAHQGSPTNNVSPTSTPAKSSNAVPTLQPPPGESGGAAASAAPEPAEEYVLINGICFEV